MSSASLLSLSRSLESPLHPDRNKAPTTLTLTPLGESVQEAWLQIPARAQTHGNKVVMHACMCMPDHFHGVIEVLEPMQWSLGDIIQAFKATCTSSWQPVPFEMASHGAGDVPS